MSIKKYTTNISVLSGGLNAPPTNQPSQYKNRQRQYFGAVSSKFNKNNAYLASNYFDAMIQGLNQDDPFMWEDHKIRMADTGLPTTATTKEMDDYKMILVASEAVNYIPQGAKIETMGSVWLSFNPENIIAAYGSGLIRRCNATWNHYDYYGNLLKEPIVIESAKAAANSNNKQQTVLVMDGYYNIFCQANPETNELYQNSRIILGRSAYKITGYGGFTQEFTGDDKSVRLIHFTARSEEINYEIDDTINKVAEGLEFSWDIEIT